MAHSKAPWSIDGIHTDGSVKLEIVDADGTVIGSTVGMSALPNAFLFIAAPDLYSSAKAILTTSKADVLTWDHLIEILKKAVAKAEGLD